MDYYPIKRPLHNLLDLPNLAVVLRILRYSKSSFPLSKLRFPYLPSSLAVPLVFGPLATLCRGPMNYLILSLLVLALLTGCATSTSRAPIVEHGKVTPVEKNKSSSTHEVVNANRSANASSYIVKRGDTLQQIALDQGLDWRELARWNDLQDPSRIQVGQVLKLTGVEERRNAAIAASDPDTSIANTAQALPITMGSPMLEKEIPSNAVSNTVNNATEQKVPKPSASAVTPVGPVAAVNSTPNNETIPVEEKIEWSWPSMGAILESFNDTKNKGIAFSGQSGDPVLAAADGQVVYAGTGLRGYGNLLIIKHNNRFLSVYAHNRALLVKEGQTVKRAQKIAELGNSDSPVPKLSFEIRQFGKPIDPLKLLPDRS